MFLHGAFVDGLQVKAAGEARESGVVAQPEDRRAHHRQAIDEALGERAPTAAPGLDPEVLALEEAVLGAQPTLWLLWKIVPRTTAGDALKLVVFVGARGPSNFVFDGCGLLCRGLLLVCNRSPARSLSSPGVGVRPLAADRPFPNLYAEGPHQRPSGFGL